jgi:hypothetical protein
LIRRASMPLTAVRRSIATVAASPAGSGASAAASPTATSSSWHRRIAAFAFCTSAYPVLGQTRARRELMGVTLGSLTFARQAGGLAGAAVFGWAALAATGGLGAAGLTVVFAAAAAVLLVAYVTASAVTSPAATSSPS